MGTMTTLPRSRPLTRADLESMPDDGHRYELIDGVLIVTPAPSFQHQAVLAELYDRLKARCPPDLTVLFAPFAVALAEDTELQPDLIVARRADFTARDLPLAPLLAVEVVSPSTRRVDLTLNRTLEQEWAYARPYRSEAERVAAFPDFLHTYNHHRGHTALKGASPADRVPNLCGQNT